MKYCKFCGKEININADFCLHCGKYTNDNNQEIKKENKNRKFPVWAIVLISVGVFYLGFMIFLGILIGTDNSGYDCECEFDEYHDYYDYEEKDFEHNKIYNIGEVIYEDDLAFKITGFNKLNNVKPKNTDSEYVAVSLTIQNLSRDENEYFGARYFGLQDSTSKVVESIEVEEYKNDIIESKFLSPNETIEGIIIFEVPKNDNKLLLIYYGSTIIKEAEFKVYITQNIL